MAPSLITLLRDARGVRKLELYCRLEVTEIVEVLSVCPEVRTVSLHADGSAALFQALTIGKSFTPVCTTTTNASATTLNTHSPDTTSRMQSLCPHLVSLTLDSLGEPKEPIVQDGDRSRTWIYRTHSLADKIREIDSELFEAFVRMVGSRGWDTCGLVGGGRRERRADGIELEECVEEGHVTRLMEVKTEDMCTTRMLWEEHVGVRERLRAFCEKGFECGLGRAFGLEGNRP